MKESTKSRKVRVFFFCKWHKKGKPLKEKRGRGKKLWDSSFKVTNKYTSLILSQVKKIWEQNLANMSSVVATLQKVEAGISLVQGYSQLQHQVWGQSWLRPFWKLKKKIKKHVLGLWNLHPMNFSFPWAIDFANTHTFMWSSHLISWYQLKRTVTFYKLWITTL